MIPAVKQDDLQWMDNQKLSIKLLRHKSVDINCLDTKDFYLIKSQFSSLKIFSDFLNAQTPF